MELGAVETLSTACNMMLQRKIPKKQTIGTMAKDAIALNALATILPFDADFASVAVYSLLITAIKVVIMSIRAPRIIIDQKMFDKTGEFPEKIAFIK